MNITEFWEMRKEAKVIKYLRENPKRAQRIVGIAFRGMTIRKIRKDAGKAKLKKEVIKASE